MHLMRYSLVTSMPTPSAEAVGVRIGQSSSSGFGKTVSPGWRVVPALLCHTFLDR